MSLDRMVEKQSGLLRQLEARDFSRVRLHANGKQFETRYKFFSLQLP